MTGSYYFSIGETNPAASLPCATESTELHSAAARSDGHTSPPHLISSNCEKYRHRKGE